MVSEVRILGPIEVGLGDGGTARVPRGRALSLLALLLVNRGAIVSLGRIVDELWEGEGPQNARNAVQVVASRLRAAVGEATLISEARGYGVRVALDADRFEDAHRRGGEVLAAGEPEEAADTLADALALWRGPALADVAGEGFAQPEIARLEDLRLACLADRIDADLACGRHDEVAGELEALVRAQPLRERLRGQQMLALYRCGRQAEALEAYRAAYQALVDGLGIEPSPELRTLEAAILRHDVPAPAAPARRVALAPDVRRRVTCLFSRLAVPGEDPESLRARAERHQEAARAACARHGGGVAELRGDALLMAFGAPVAHEDDALRALRTAAELRDRPRAAGARRRHRRRRRAADRRGAGRRGASRPRRRAGRGPRGRGHVAARAPRRARPRAARRRLRPGRRRRGRPRDPSPARPAAARPRPRARAAAPRVRARARRRARPSC